MLSLPFAGFSVEVKRKWSYPLISVFLSKIFASGLAVSCPEGTVSCLVLGSGTIVFAVCFAGLLS